MKFAKLYHLLIENVEPSLILENAIAKPEKYYNRLFQVGDRILQIQKKYPDASPNALMDLIKKTIQIINKEPNISLYLNWFLQELFSTTPGKYGEYTFRDLYNHYFGYGLTRIKHFNDYNINEIDNFDWRHVNGFDELEETFTKIEAAHNAAQSEWIRDIDNELTTGKVAIIEKFPDGFVWMDLKRHYCRIEGNAMGHCGSGDYDSTLLSLRKLERKPNGKMEARPSLTFNLLKDGFLGEMKGRGNEKPKEKYHPYIIALLMHKNPDGTYLVKGIRGGGYDPESNFSIEDLNSKNLSIIVNQRPELIPEYLRMKTEGLTESLIESMISKFQSKPDLFKNLKVKKIKGGWDSNKKGFTEDLAISFALWDNYKDFLWLIPNKTFPDNMLQYYETVKGETDAWDFDSFNAPEETIYDLFDKWAEDDQNKLSLMEYMRDNYPEEITDDIEISDYYGILKNNEDSIIDSARQAVNDGMRMGSEGEMINSFFSGIEDLVCTVSVGGDYETYDFTYEVSFDDSDHKFDSPVRCHLTAFEFFKALYKAGLDFSYLEKRTFIPDSIEGDMNVPYYGFSEYDEEAALQTFKDFINI